jgi:CheY-like chemotaxis protein
MDGYEAMRAIRSDPRYADLPIIALTAKVIAGEPEKAIAAGANEYVQKPADVNVLLAVVHALLDPENADIEPSSDLTAAGPNTEVTLSDG